MRITSNFLSEINFKRRLIYYLAALEIYIMYFNCLNLCRFFTTVLKHVWGYVSFVLSLYVMFKTAVFYQV